MKRVFVVFIALVLTACGGGGKANFTDPTDRVEVMSWWVSASERPALRTLLDAYKSQHPGVQVIDGSIAGGGGSNVQIALASRLRAGDPPDVWQTFLGSSLRAWVDADQIADVTGIYDRGRLQAQLPGKLFDALTVGGKQWGVPTGAHRSNNVWFNTKVLSAAGVAVPAAGYTKDQFLADLAKVKSAGKAPLCLGAKDRFTAVELFESALLSQVGADGWSRIANDRFDWSGTQLRAALDDFAAVLANSDTEAAALTWDQAAKKFTEGQCAFLSMNDSVYGELVADGLVAGTDFGYVAYPGTEGNYLAIVDTFVASAKSQNGRNAIDFLESLTNPETTVAFNKVKGSVPIVKNANLSGLSQYQRDASQALWRDNVLLSITHGELMKSSFQGALYDAVAAFISSRDQQAFIDTLQRSVTAPMPGR